MEGGEGGGTGDGGCEGEDELRGFGARDEGFDSVREDIT